MSKTGLSWMVYTQDKGKIDINLKGQRMDQPRAKVSL
jgi:hypothetical protein